MTDEHNEFCTGHCCSGVFDLLINAWELEYAQLNKRIERAKAEDQLIDACIFEEVSIRLASCISDLRKALS